MSINASGSSLILLCQGSQDFLVMDKQKGVEWRPNALLMNVIPHVSAICNTFRDQLDTFGRIFLLSLTKETLEKAFNQINTIILSHQDLRPKYGSTDKRKRSLPPKAICRSRFTTMSQIGCVILRMPANRLVRYPEKENKH